MFHHGEILLLLTSLWLVEGQPGTVRQGDYDVLRNNSGGPILCASDQPQFVRTDVRSRLHCSTTCLQNDQCLSFNYKDTVTAGQGYTCEHFSGYPYKFTVDPACRHYAVRTNSNCVLEFKNATEMPQRSSIKGHSKSPISVSMELRKPVHVTRNAACY